MAEAKELLMKLVGNRFQIPYELCWISPVSSTLERIHEEINRHLRPLLACLWRILDGDSEQLTDVGFYMSGGIYNRMPIDYNCPIYYKLHIIF